MSDDVVLNGSVEAQASAEVQAAEAQAAAEVQAAEAVAAAEVAAAKLQAEHASGELFRVVGDRAVYGVEPGQVGRLLLSQSQRFALVASGHIEPVASAPENN